MWYFAYNIGLLLAAPVILSILVAKKRCRQGLAQRLGFYGKGVPSRTSSTAGQRGDLVWFHAVSMGEVATVAPLIRELHARHPEYRVLVSTATETGREAVMQRLGGQVELCYAPLDFPWVVARFVDRVRPKAFIFVDTEIWPNLLRVLARHEIPAILVNGRLSPRSLRRKAKIKSFWSQVLSNVTWFLMQSDQDAERLAALDAPRSRIRTTGTLKFDQPEPQAPSGTVGFTRATIHLRDDEELFVAGSTHPGEEEQLLECYKRLHRRFPQLVLLLAPRHVERSADVAARAASGGLHAVRRSTMGGGGEMAQPSRPRVIVLDTRGELIYAYREAKLAFVGGTFAPIGGHNLLEPALWGKAVFFGPHTDHCADVARLLVEGGGGVQVSDESMLEAELAKVLEDPTSLQAMGQAARRVLDENQGALPKTLDVIERALGNPGDLSAATTEQETKNDGRAATPEEITPGPGTSSTAVSEPGTQLPAAGLHQPSGLRSLLRWLVAPYGLLVRARAALYLHGWLNRRKLPRPVISIGNLTVGGTGKTPMVILLTNWLVKQGRRVAVLSRGYRRRSKEAFLLVSNGDSLVADPLDAGDEPHLIARRCPGAVVAVGADRYRVGRWVMERFPVDCFVLDDGFQHLALERDVDLLLVDASDPEGLSALFPAGRLREPVSAAVRATALVFTRVDGSSDWKQRLGPVLAASRREREPILVRFTAEHIVDGATGNVEPIEALGGRAAVAFCGIANVGSFRNLLTQVGANVVAEHVFRDHHRYTRADVEQLLRLAESSGAGVFLTTEKDAGKAAPLFPPEARLLAVRLGVEILEGREQLESLVLGELDRHPAVACA